MFLIRGEILSIAEVHHVAKSWRAWRHFLRIKEIRIERIVSIGGTVDGSRQSHAGTTTFEYSNAVLRIEKADHRPHVVRGLVRPLFQVAQEVMYATVGTEILCRRPAGMRKSHVPSAGYRHAIEGGGSAPMTLSYIGLSWIQEALIVVPIVRQKRYGIVDHCRGRMR